MVYYENKDFQQTTGEEQAKKLAEQNLESCRNIYGEAYFWAMFALLIVGLISMFVANGMSKRAAEPTTTAQDIFGIMSDFGTTHGKVKIFGSLCLLAVVGMFAAMLVCRLQGYKCSL